MPSTVLGVLQILTHLILFLLLCVEGSMTMNNHVSEITLFPSLHPLPSKILQMLGKRVGREEIIYCPTAGAYSCSSGPWALAAPAF